MWSERLRKEQEGLDFISKLKFGDVFPSKEWPYQFVFLHQQKNGSPDCLMVLDSQCKNYGNVQSKNFTLGASGTITLEFVIPTVIFRLSLLNIENRFRPTISSAREQQLKIIQKWAENSI